jgi:HK97 family phage prohead protease
VSDEVVYRSFEPDLEVRSAAQGGDGRTIVGIAVPYGRPQRIDRSLVEQFNQGAFNHQLRASHRVPFARNHQKLGGTLIGKTISMRDDAAGLYGEWRVSKTPSGDETLELVKDGVLSQLSIGFREDKNRRLPDGTVARTRAHLTEVAVVPEGAYGHHAAISGVRSAGDEEGTPRLDAVRRLLAASSSPHLLGVLVRSQSNLDNTPNGEKLWKYWTGPEGFARYAGSPEPWTTLRKELLKEGVPAAEVDGLATNIMMATAAGEALFNAHHKGKSLAA